VIPRPSDRAKCREKPLFQKKKKNERKKKTEREMKEKTEKWGLLELRCLGIKDNERNVEFI
jgi:hypothetical protein